MENIKLNRYKVYNLINPHGDYHDKLKQLSNEELLSLVGPLSEQDKKEIELLKFVTPLLTIDKIPNDVLTDRVLSVLNMKSLVAFLTASELTQQKKLEIVEILFNKKYGPSQTWADYIYRNPEFEINPGFEANPGLALYAYAISKYIHDKRDLKTTIIFRNGTKEIILHRYEGEWKWFGTFHSEQIFTDAEIIDSYFKKANIYSHVHVKTGEFDIVFPWSFDDEEAYRLYRHSIQTFVFLLLTNGYTLTDITVGEQTKDKFEYLFSCISCGIESAGKCETCQQGFCSVSCFDKNHPKGYCKK